MRDDNWFVFYGQTESPDKSVAYRTNSGNMELPDDVEMKIKLNQVSNGIEKIVLCLTIYEASKKNLNFGKVDNMYLRLLDESDHELMHFEITDLAKEVTSLVVGELYRYNGTWRFYAVASGYQRDLAQFCRIYGVEIE